MNFLPISNDSLSRTEDLPKGIDIVSSRLKPFDISKSLSNLFIPETENPRKKKLLIYKTFPYIHTLTPKTPLRPTVLDSSMHILTVSNSKTHGIYSLCTRKPYKSCK